MALVERGGGGIGFGGATQPKPILSRLEPSDTTAP